MSIRDGARLVTPEEIRMQTLLQGDLDFQNADGAALAHQVHSFPAKYPPQLPAKFIEELTNEGDIVLDPMMGSGTTILEAYLSGRQGIGFDIDPLAIRIANVKTTPLDRMEVARAAHGVIANARCRLATETSAIDRDLENRWDGPTKEFVEYWFAVQTRRELMSLVTEIEAIREPAIRAFMEVAMSAAIITKSGGVSLALDLAHTRPHKAKVVVDTSGNSIIELKEDSTITTGRLRHVSKRLRSAIDEFEKRVNRNIEGLLSTIEVYHKPEIEYADAQQMPLEDSSVDLIVTSPPYASNAIDYMRAHKFSLVWLGYSIDELGEKRAGYIGGESVQQITFEDLPELPSVVVGRISALHPGRGKALHRYYSEMTRVLREMHRVLRPGKSAILVVGSSLMKGIETWTADCLRDIGQSVGFNAPLVGVRSISRDRRMLPVGITVDATSQIQKRMHVEFVIAFTKPQ